MMSFIQNLIQSLPNPVKIFIGFGLVGLLVTGVLQADLLNTGSEPSETEYVEVQILVEDESGEFLSDVEVQVISQGSPFTTYTTDSGYARVDIPTRGDVDIVLKKDGYETRREIIDFDIDPSRNKRFRLNKNDQSLDESKSINAQIYTTQNEFMPLLLSILTPNTDNPLIKKIFSESLGIDTNPLVYLKSPINQTINRFKEETGNENREEEILNVSGVTYFVRDNESDISISGKIGKSSDDSKPFYLTQSEASQSDESFDEEKIKRSLLEGEENYFGTFYFAPLMTPFSSNPEDAEYTFISEFSTNKSGVKGNIFQYPKLANISGENLVDRTSSSGYQEGKPDLTWIKKVIQNNPNHRGILAFSYPYTDGILDYFDGCGSGIFFSGRYTPSLYIKFVDIENIQDKPISIDSVSYLMVEKNSYELTDADSRTNLFNKSPISQHVEKVGVSLQPGKHLFIPIEFGLNTDAQKSEASIKSGGSINEANMSAKTCYVGRVNYESSIQNASSNEEITRILMAETRLNDTFISNISSPDEVFIKIPTLIAIGPIINVDSIVVDGVSISIPSPSDTPTVYVSRFFDAGSCPYLKVYDSEYENWIERGRILYMINNKELQREEVYDIGNRIKKIRIEEREPEVSYLDNIFFTYMDSESDTIHQAVYPTAELSSENQIYLSLRQGESLEINIQDMVPETAFEIKLHVNGYYEALDNEERTK